MLKEKIVGYEISKLARACGFSNGSDNYYHEFNDDYVYDDDPNHQESHKKGEVRCYRHFHINKLDSASFEAPTQSILQRWLREEHKIIISILPIEVSASDTVGYRFSWFTHVDGLEDSTDFFGFLTYEDALENALTDCLKYLNNKQQ